MDVIKRDGSREAFDEAKIYHPISMAMGHDIAMAVAKEIKSHYALLPATPTTGQIEEQVINRLIELGLDDTASFYEGYNGQKEKGEKDYGFIAMVLVFMVPSILLTLALAIYETLNPS